MQSGSQPILFDVPQDFTVEAIVGQGAYGAVCKASWNNNHVVAIKKVPHYSKSPDTARKVLREVEILQHFQFIQQVVPCHTIFRPSSGEKDVYAVMDYVGSDISSAVKAGVTMDEDVIRYIAAQLLLGLRGMHKHGCLHRDLSTRNILINESSEVFVCDFGLSRFFDPEEQLSFGVVTQWYRAPEIITDAKYDHKVDLFSIGVILGELFLRKHLFPGKPNDSADQLHKIFLILGTPSADLFENEGSVYFTSSLNAKKYAEMYIKKRPQTSRVAALPFQVQPSPEGLEVLKGLLSFNPTNRPSADEALRHPWFENLREFIDGECAAQDEAEPFTFTDVSKMSLDQLVEAIEAAVPMYSPELQEKWRAAAEEVMEAETGGGGDE